MRRSDQPRLPPRARAWARWLAWVLGAAVGVCALALIGLAVLPSVLDGPRLARLVLARVPPLCGQLEAKSLSLGRLALLDVLVGRPFSVQIDDLALRDDSGQEVLSGDVQAEARLTKTPGRWEVQRVDVLSLSLTGGHWRMEVGRDGGLTLLAALRPRSACTATTTPPRRSASKSSPPSANAEPGHILSLAQVRLVDMEVSFSFPVWALTLAHTTTEGHFELGWGGHDGTRVSFAAERAEAGASQLRVGRTRDSWLTRVPFDHVSISRVAVTPDSPDLALDVTAATTGQASLAGQAVFRDVFARGRHAEPGLDLEARWTGFAGAARALEARWREVLRRAVGTDDVALHATSHGPFSALAAGLDLDAEALGFSVRLTPRRHLTARWTLRDLPTGPRLPASLRPLLGGRANGHFELEAQLAPRLADMEARLTRVALSLVRTRPGPFPRVFLLTAGDAPAVPTPGTSADDVLAVRVGGARLRAGVLTLEGLASTWRGTDLAAHGQLIFQGPAPHLDATLAIRGADLARTWPGGPLGGTVALDVRMRGDADDARLAFTFPGPRTVVVRGHRLTFPRRAAAWIRGGERLGLEGLTLTGDEGTRLSVAGNAVWDRDLHLAIDAAQVPLAWLAGTVSGVPPDLSGRLDGRVAIEGPVSGPGWTGSFAATHLVAWRTRWPDLALRFGPTKGAWLALEGALGEMATFDGRAESPTRLKLHGTFRQLAVPLGVWVPSLPALGLRLVGEVQLALDRHGLSAEARLDELGVHGSPWPFHNEGPVVVTAGGGRVALAATRLAGPGVSVDLHGTWKDERIDAAADGTLEVSALAFLVRQLRSVRLDEGSLTFRATATGPARAPAVRGEVQVAAPLAPLATWPLRITRGVVHLETDGAGQSPWQARLENASLETAARADHGVASLDGEATLSPAFHLRAGTAHVVGTLESRALAPFLPAGAPVLAGLLHLDGRAAIGPGSLTVAGSLSTPLLRVTAPALRGALELRDLAVRYDDGALHVPPFMLTLATGGAARVSLDADLRSAPNPRIELSARGTNMTLPVAVAGLDFRSADFDLHLAGPDARARYLASGEVFVRDARVDAKRPKPSGGLASKGLDLTRWLSRVDLDLRLQSPTTTAVAPGPDLALAADCRVKGPLLGPSLGGVVRGRTLYARTMLALYDWVKGAHLRRCAP